MSTVMVGETTYNEEATAIQSRHQRWKNQRGSLVVLRDNAFRTREKMSLGYVRLADASKGSMLFGIKLEPEWFNNIEPFRMKSTYTGALAFKGRWKCFRALFHIFPHL